MPGSYYEEDEWHEHDYHRGNYGYVQPPPLPRAPPRRSGDLLTPVADYSTNLRRSRSHGHSPAPNIYVYNRTDVENRDPSPGPSRGRRDDRTGDVLERLDDIDRTVRRLSRSRGPPEQRAVSPWRQQHDYEEHLRLQEANNQIARLESDRRAQHEYFDRQREDDLRRKRWELEQIRNERLEAERRASDTSRLEEREKLLKKEMKAKMLQDELDRKNAEAKIEAERERILLENERAKAKARMEEERLKLQWKAKEDEEEEERKKLIAEAQLKADQKKKKEEDEEKAAVARWEQKKLDQKKEEEALRAKFKAEEEARKAKEKAEEEEWALKLKLKKEAEEAKEKARKQELEDEMHKKLAVFGFQENQIQAVLDPKKAGDLPAGYAPGKARPARPAIGWNQPTYIKVSREHLDVETLKYYNLRYEIDGTDPRYVVILEEISEEETQMLFDHTRKLRRGSSTLLIEDRGRGRDHQYAFVRKRNPSKSPARKQRDKSPINVGFRLF